jgi:hypothetical protein
MQGAGALTTFATADSETAEGLSKLFGNIEMIVPTETVNGVSMTPQALKMAEDHLYWVAVYERWMDDENFRKGPIVFFQRVPAPIRPFVTAMVRRNLRARLRGQGLGRHSRDEIAALGTRSIDAIAEFLADKPYFLGAEPTGVDATMFAFAAGVLCPLFKSALRGAAEQHDNLRRYVGRMTARFYPEIKELAGCKAVL